MKLHTLYAALAALVIGSPFAGAETVSQKEAAKLAHIFFNEAAGRMTPKPKLVWNGKQLTMDRLFSPFYVYNTPTGGFVMISAENKAFPILAYSLKTNFDPERLSDDEKALFADFARDIEHIRYVSDIPSAAVAAWQNIPVYITSLLDAPYVVTDPHLSSDDVALEVESMAFSPMADRLSSDLYTQPQWQEVINADLVAGHDVLLGIISERRVAPAVIHGRKGDYYRIRFNRQNDWLVRLNASEIYSGWQIAGISNPAELPAVEEEPPFAFLDGMMAEFARDREREEAALSMTLTPDTPRIKSIGGGRFEIIFPENVDIARVYNVSGAMVAQYTYRDTDVAHIDIAAEPSGFYVALVRGVGGTPYGLKLYR